MDRNIIFQCISYIFIPIDTGVGYVCKHCSCSLNKKKISCGQNCRYY